MSCDAWRILNPRHQHVVLLYLYISASFPFGAHGEILCDHSYHCEGNPSFWQLPAPRCRPYVRGNAASNPSVRAIDSAQLTLTRLGLGEAPSRCLLCCSCPFLIFWPSFSLLCYLIASFFLRLCLPDDTVSVPSDQVLLLQHSAFCRLCCCLQKKKVDGKRAVIKPSVSTVAAA